MCTYDTDLFLGQTCFSILFNKFMATATIERGVIIFRKWFSVTSRVVLRGCRLGRFEWACWSKPVLPLLVCWWCCHRQWSIWPRLHSWSVRCTRCTAAAVILANPGLLCRRSCEASTVSTLRWSKWNYPVSGAERHTHIIVKYACGICVQESIIYGYVLVNMYTHFTLHVKRKRTWLKCFNSPMHRIGRWHCPEWFGDTATVRVGSLSQRWAFQPSLSVPAAQWCFRRQRTGCHRCQYLGQDCDQHLLYTAG